MGFGADLQGKESHEALVRIQDAEIRLLENIKRCMQMRIDTDKKYATALSQLVSQAHKVNADPANEFTPLCSVFKVWDVVVRETHQLALLFGSSSEELSSKTLEKLTSLISEKKSARKFYSDERNRLEADFTKLQDELGKSKSEYHRLVDRLRLDKARFEDLYRKGKGRLEEAKVKYLRSTVKLHKLHNDYVLGIKETQLHQGHYLDKNLPTFLDYHQNTQHILVEQCKDILLDYSRLTNLGQPQYQDIYNAIQDAVQGINPDEEYNKFMQENRSDPLGSLRFEFDEKLLDDYQGSLQVDQLACDDLTLETLKHRRAIMEDKLNVGKSVLSNTKAELSQMVEQLEDVRNKLIQEADEVIKNDYYVKRRAMEILKRKFTDDECDVAKQQALFDTLDRPLKELGDKAPPPGLELPDMNGLEGIADLSNSSGSSASSGLSAFKDIFKGLRKASGGGLMLPGKDDIHLSKSDSRSHLPTGGTSYDPVQKGVNGSGEPKFQIQDDFVPKNLEDEEWFHGILPREEVIRLLQHDGDFLVRESKNRKNNETQFVLSVFWMVPKHFIIQRCEGGWRFEGQIFPTMSELIHFQLTSGEPVTSKSQAILKTPILREEWELKNDDIELQQKIGNGNFGEVFKGLFRPKGMVVAVKTCRDTLKEEQRKTFMTEGRILKQYEHPNIVQFIGIATQRQPVMIIMEYCSGGALLGFLRKQGKAQTKRTLVMMCRDAASGMAYLEEKGCIHRDLAARNCLIAAQNVVKISDFGMSREEEEYTVSEGMKQIPIKWTAPEALNYGKYTSLCDVWSYGILMWEVFSCGTTPYVGMSNSVAREQIETGYRMPAPEGTPDSAYQLMLKCWEYQPEKRLHFKEIHQELLRTLNTL